MSPQPDGGEDYKPQDAVKKGISAGLLYGGIGLFAAATISAVQRKRVGVLAPFTKFGSLVTTVGLGGGMYEFTSTAMANLRKKNDHYNEAVGGFVGGSILGLGFPGPARLPVVLGYGAASSVALAVYAYTGKSLRGWGKDPAVDEFDRKEYLRNRRRIPIEETIAELGEGRGIKAPGYEERRRQRLKEKYGVEINPVSADPNAAPASE